MHLKHRPSEGPLTHMWRLGGREERRGEEERGGGELLVDN